jgi:hypothetical protein
MSITSKTHTHLLQRFAAIGQTEVERLTGVDNTQLSKFVKGERGLRIDQIEPVLTALGLKVVGANENTIDAEYLSALEILSRRGIGSQNF